jgi:O-antigen/teichoic acid export membrane protein
VAVASVVAALVNLVLNVALVPVFGLSGSAAATLLAYAALHVLLLRVVPSDLRVAPPAARRLGELAAACAVALVLAEIVPMSAPWLVARTFVAVVCGVWLVRVAFHVTVMRRTVAA